MSNIPTLYEKFQNFRPFKRHDGEYGVEIETETIKEYAVPKMGLWDHHADGSLRNFGIEYVLKAPLKFGNDLEAAFVEFRDKTIKIPFVEDSITTSVHVHMNVLNENMVTFGNILTLYALFEPILIEFSGPSRKSNLFCLGMADAEETYRNIKVMLDYFQKKSYSIVDNFTRDNAKYAALNLASLGTFGSLEFRSFRGTADLDAIRRWVGILNSILVFARQEINPHDIVTMYKNRGSEILGDVFGEYRRDLRMKKEEELLDKNFWYAAQIAYCIKDWNAFRKDSNRKKPSAKDLDKYAQSLYSRDFNALGADEQRYILNHIDEIIDSLEGSSKGKKKKVVMEGRADAVWIDNAPPAPMRVRGRNDEEEAFVRAARDLDLGQRVQAAMPRARDWGGAAPAVEFDPNPMFGNNEEPDA